MNARLLVMNQRRLIDAQYYVSLARSSLESRDPRRVGEIDTYVRAARTEIDLVHRSMPTSNKDLSAGIEMLRMFLDSVSKQLGDIDAMSVVAVAAATKVSQMRVRAG